MGRQLALRFNRDAEPESVLNDAGAGAGSPDPCQVAIHVPAVAICVRNVAAAEIRRKVSEMREASLTGVKRRRTTTTH
jgi:hypothetical protein